jgi:DNA/RNA endonuclease G (NUC1)
MKPFKLILLVCCLYVSITSAQTVKHQHYITYYNPTLKEPDSVAWDLSPAMVSCNHTVKRKDKFKADPGIPGSGSPKDYVRSGYDKGHLFNYEDASYDSIDRVECFYMSNMLPQLHSFNAGDWKTLETQERLWAASTPIHIIAGGIGSKGSLPAGENIPAFMWKAIYQNGRWTCWIMPNEVSSKGHAFGFWEVPAAVLDRQTGLQL